MSRLPDSENLIQPTPEPRNSILQTKTGPVVHQDNPSISLAGRQVIAGRYAILGQLGRGGMGEVWHAFDLKLRVDVALKSLRTDRAKQDVESLRREVRTAREVISPNVCRIFDLVVEDQQELVSMEYIDGITLAELLQKNGPLNLQHAADVATQFLSGLQAIHQAGLVHRDFKPENVMITRTGRVVVMDFGIAKPVAQFSETISGTPSYMAPEQLEGRKLDPRSDIFAAGVVLAEMIASEGVKTKESREALLKSMRQEPLVLPDHPWKKVIAQAVTKNYEDRFASAAAMSKALEEVVQRFEGDEAHRPYPGLNAFTEADAEFFFGRELEAESILKKLQQLHLFAMIGPSGAGKTSLLQAGIIPAIPDDWSFIFCQPGNSPFVNLAQALIPEFSGDDEVTRRMLRFEELNTALEIFRRWRKNHKEVVLIVDRFEELFTLNAPKVQSNFAELLGHAAVDEDVRVLLAMRDDFLFHCQQYSVLAPIFSDLTPLGLITGSELRRAIVEPALKCGYRFEDDELVGEILADVEKERGALPLLAFAVSRLWEKRDRQSGTLTHKAYNEIGGVAGALAQHAESTMERIGIDKHEIVREIFRNLITAQNTRAARDTEELLSVFQQDFGGRASVTAAEEVLRILIDARLLTSFEVKQENKNRVEIIHESLLSAWPRLVRWQTQDADSAQLRDQLRQAAHLWQERGRSPELLWTGASYKEFELWRERYSGGLSSTEELFAQAMIQHAEKRRQRRRFALALAFVIIVAIAAMLGLFWQRSEVSRSKAESETRRAEASKLLALAQLEAETYPTAALAYAIKSLELTDTMEARMFALKMTQQAPLAIVFNAAEQDGLEARSIDFSPEGKWLAVGGTRRAQIRSLDGNGPILLNEYPSRGISICDVRFAPNGDRLFTDQFGEIRKFSIPAGKEQGRWKLAEGASWMYRTADGLFIFVRGVDKEAIHFISNGEAEPQLLGHIPLVPYELLGTTLLYTNEEQRKIYLRSLKDLNAPPRFLLEQPEQIQAFAWHPGGKQFASIDRSGQISIFSIDPFSSQPLRMMQSSDFFSLLYDATGNRLAAGGNVNGLPIIHVYDLTAPPGTMPLVLIKTGQGRGGVSQGLVSWTFHSSGKWIATANDTDVALWPLPTILSKTINHKGLLINVAFTPDGQHLLSVSQGKTIRSWPVTGRIDEATQVVLQDSFFFPGMKIEPRTNRFAVTARRGRVLVANLDGTNLRTLEGFSKNATLFAVAFSVNGRLVAASSYSGPKADKVVRVWNLDSGQVSVFGPVVGAGEGQEGGVVSIDFIDDNRFAVSGYGGLQIFDISKKTSKILSRKPTMMTLARNRQFLVAKECDDMQSTKGCKMLRISLEIDERTILSFPAGEFPTLDSTGQILLNVSEDGKVRVGKLLGHEPYVLFAHKGFLDSLAVSPDGKWIASGGRDGTIRLTPMPDLSKPAPHTLPYGQFLTKLKSFTNLRVVADPNSSTGWKVEVGKFPGWEKVPSW